MTLDAIRVADQNQLVQCQIQYLHTLCFRSVDVAILVADIVIGGTINTTITVHGRGTLLKFST